MKTSAFKCLLCVIFLSLFSHFSKAQNYHNAIGLRFGAYTGISYKQFVSSKNAFELYGLLRFYNNYSFSNITGVYQIHENISGVPNLKWYYGLGATVGFYKYRDAYYGSRLAGANIGILGTLGLDLALRDVPFNITLDWSPTFYINNGSRFYGDYAQIGLRYILSR